MVHELFKIFNWVGSEWVLIILFVLSILSLFVILQRYADINRLAKTSDRFWAEQAEAWFQGADMTDAMAKREQLRQTYPCLETESLELLARSASMKTSDAERSLGAYLDTRKLKLEKNVGILATIGANAPFIGLLGTVLGIIRAFHEMSIQGLGTSSMDSISGGIAESLVATAIGLVVAIPAVVFFNLLNKRIATLVRRAQSVSSFVLAQSGKGD